MRERGFCATQHDISHNKNKYSIRERSLRRANIFRERKKNNIVMHQQCKWRQNSQQAQGEQGACVHMCFFIIFLFKRPNKHQCLRELSNILEKKNACLLPNLQSDLLT